MQPVWALGLMTGTVLDGFVDIAMIKTDGEDIQQFGPWALVPYPNDINQLLQQAVKAAQQWNFNGPQPEIFRQAELALTIGQSQAINQFLADQNIPPADISVVGFHGQTVLHRGPKSGQRGHTCQLGDGNKMAQTIGIDIVYDLRTADINAGGQGAPLAPIYHQSLLKKIGGDNDSAILNLGGVANITWYDGTNLIAFDLGPANAPLNDWIKSHNHGKMDVDGKVAASGTVDEARLEQLASHPFLTTPYPKSLDRNDFTAKMVDGLTFEDGAATLTAFTAVAIAKALDLLPSRPKRLIVCGGGRKNPVMMAEIVQRSGAIAISADSVGLRGDAIEAECFAYLAVRSMRNLPISYPLTTGVATPTHGGVLVKHDVDHHKQ